jgi:iron complex outermembrane recepter protein
VITPRRHRRTPSLRALCLLFLGLTPGAALPADEFLDLDLREMLDLEITTASRKPQSVSEAAAAVYVLTADDIRRSPARTLPDLLRTVPGLQVASITSSSWAVSARGLNGRFSNKLLVLIDGRSVYSPTFSGVYWDVQDTALEDIERIEVVRGPGGTLWGANAFHGVINIITKSAASALGTSVTLGAGAEQRLTAGIRHGAALGSTGHYRLYMKGFSRGASLLSTTGMSARDDWRGGSVGARADFNPDEANAYTLQGDYYRGEAGEPTIVNVVRAPYRIYNPTETHFDGANLLGRWQRQTNGADSFTLQGFLDYTHRNWPARIAEKRLTYDLDFQYHLRALPRQDVILGFSARGSDDRIACALRGVPADSQQLVQRQADGDTQYQYSLFAQNDISLRPDMLILTLGGKFERFDDTGAEFSPNVRLLWTPAPAWSVWAAASKAVRTPSRVDRRGQVVVGVEQPDGFANPQPEVFAGFNQFASPLPVLLQQGMGQVGSERVIAYELGLKHRMSETMSVDVAGFYNDYSHLRTLQVLPLLCAPSGGVVPACLRQPPGTVTYLIENTAVGNGGHGYGRGAELAVNWLPASSLRLRGALSLFKSSTIADNANGEFETDRDTGSPRSQWSLTTYWNPRADTEMTLGLRRVGQVAPALGINLPGYTELDARFAWRPRANIELAIHGRNLLHAQHQEYASELQEVALTSVQRSVFGQLSLRF